MYRPRPRPRPSYDVRAKKSTCQTIDHAIVRVMRVFGIGRTQTAERCPAMWGRRAIVFPQRTSSAGTAGISFFYWHENVPCVPMESKLYARFATQFKVASVGWLVGQSLVFKRLLRYSWKRGLWFSCRSFTPAHLCAYEIHSAKKEKEKKLRRSFCYSSPAVESWLVPASSLSVTYFEPFVWKCECFFFCFLSHFPVPLFLTFTM